MSKDKQGVVVDNDPVEVQPRIKFHKEPNKSKRLKEVWQRVNYAIIPFLCIIVALLSSWLANQLFGSPTGMQPNLAVDKYIPYVPQFAIFYFLCFPVCIVTYFVLAYRNRARLYDITALIVICYIISAIFYWSMPTEFPLEWKYSWLPENWTPETLGFWDRLAYNTWHSSLPTCLLPSQHCFMAIACILTLVGVKKTHWTWTLFTIIFNVCVVLATVFLKQHFLMDFVASLAIMSIVYLILRLTKFGDRLDAKILCAKNKRSKK